MIKLIASDLDGTLILNGAQSLSEELFPLIKMHCPYILLINTQTKCRFYPFHIVQ